MYKVASPYYLLNDKPASTYEAPQVLSERFDELYHLFLVKVARLPQEEPLSRIDERRLIELFTKINDIKREMAAEVHLEE